MHLLTIKIKEETKKLFAFLSCVFYQSAMTTECEEGKKKDSVSERPWGLVDLGKDSKHGSHRKDEQGII